MNLVKIVGRYNGVKGELSITMNILPECRETDKCYVWSRNRIKKSDIGVVDSMYYNHTLVDQTFSMYTLSDSEYVTAGIITMKAKVLARIKKMVEENQALIQRAEATALIAEPVWEETVRDRY